jgi:hypothetical protein
MPLVLRVPRPHLLYLLLNVSLLLLVLVLLRLLHALDALQAAQLQANRHGTGSMVSCPLFACLLSCLLLGCLSDGGRQMIGMYRRNRVPRRHAAAGSHSLSVLLLSGPGQTACPCVLSQPRSVCWQHQGTPGTYPWHWHGGEERGGRVSAGLLSAGNPESSSSSTHEMLMRLKVLPLLRPVSRPAFTAHMVLLCRASSTLDSLGVAPPPRPPLASTMADVLLPCASHEPLAQPQIRGGAQVSINTHKHLVCLRN